MNWVRTIAVILVFWSTVAWGATLTWQANTEPDLAGYHVYHCSHLPCAKASGTATLLATLGKVTSFNIGIPAVVQYYMLTAYDSKNNESPPSAVATYHPGSASPPPSTPPPAWVGLTVLGYSNLNQPWAVQATTTAAGTIAVQFWINGALTHIAHTSPYCAFDDTSGSCTKIDKPAGYYTVEARVLSNGIEVGRRAIIVNATGVPFPPAWVGLSVLGYSNLNQPWAVQATTTAVGSIAVQFRINGVLATTEATSPYCAFGDISGSCTRVDKPAGYYTVEARVLSNGIEVGRQVMVVTAT